MVDQDEAKRKEQGARLKQARDLAGFRSARDAALQNGWKESSYRAHEGGTRTIGQNDAEKYAKRFRQLGVHTTAEAILFGGPKPRNPVDSLPGHSVAVVGRIGAGAEIMPEFEQVPPEGLFEIESVIPILDGSIAFEVDGESMAPRYDPGDVIVCQSEGVPPDQLIGQEAAVRTSDGKRYLKTIIRGAIEGTFDLESHNAKPIRGVRLVWASSVDQVVRAGKWKKLAARERQRLTKAAMKR